MKPNVFFLPLIILLFSACDSGDFKSVERKSESGELISRYYAFLPNNSPVLMLTDEDHNGTLEDTLYLTGNLEDPKSSRAVYGEKRDDDGKVHTKIYMGPDAIKLVEHQDQNGDGFFETRTYFNRNAVPTVTMGIVARVEYYDRESQKLHAVLYPPGRVEVVSNQDGSPERLIQLPRQADLVACSKNLADSGICDGSESALSTAESYYLNPYKIPNEMNRAMIPYSLPAVEHNYGPAE